jgi:hypothetical protein
VTVLVERELELKGDGAAVVRVYAAERHPRFDWVSRVELSWDRSFEIFGVDQWQAVQLAMRFAPSAIVSTDAFKEGRLALWGKTVASFEEFRDLFDAIPPTEGPGQ